MYDFRDGILLEKVVYKDESCNFGYVLLYLSLLLLTWAWGCAWFALFFYSYVFHEKVAFIVFIVIWAVFAITVIIIGFLTIQRSKNEKMRKRREKEERQKQMEEINEARRRRNEHRFDNNLDDINTNADQNIINNSERRLISENEHLETKNNY